MSKEEHKLYKKYFKY